MTAHNFDAELIERVVQAVIQRLAEQGVQVTAEPADSGGSALWLAERVVSLATLEGRLDGVTRVVVASRAVVTPAVKDELRDKQITLARE